MSAELISAVPSAVARQRRPMYPVLGVLFDGTPYYAPIGEVIVTDARVTCHLCGRSFRSVTAHLRSHGWTKERYCEAFGLERGQPLEGEETRKLRSAAFTARLIFEPAIREGSAAGRARARSGELAKDAAAAARGRSFPEQRRRKNAEALAANRSAAAAATAAARERADGHLAATAAAAAARHGYEDIGSLVAARIGAGVSLASVSRELGLHKDWLSRHLARIDPVAAEIARHRSRAQPDAAWLPALARFGFCDVAAYLRDRHLVQRLTVNLIAAEIGMSHHAVQSALRRHGLIRTPHVTKRHAAEQRAAEVAGRLGFPTLTDYVTHRRAADWTWKAIAAESGQPPTWLRRHAPAGAPASDASADPPRCHASADPPGCHA